MCGIEMVGCKPALHFLATCNAVLDLFQRCDACFECSNLLNCGIQYRILPAQNLFQLGDAFLLGFEPVTLLATLGIEFRSALPQVLEFSSIRYDQRRIFLTQTM